MIQFVFPAALLGLLLLPVLFFWKGRRGRAPALRFPTSEVARLVAKRRRTRPGSVLGVLRMLVLGFIVIGVARPQLVHSHTQIEASGIDILLAVDVSTSMEALDFEIDGEPVRRVDVVKKVVGRFVKERPNDRIGLVAFAGRPYMLTPLTLDHDWLQERLDVLDTGIVEDGTAIGSAIAASANRLRGQDATSRIVILLTDGVNNGGKVTPVTAAEAAAALDIKVYTIGAGTKGEAPVAVQDAFGRTRLRRVKVDIDEEMLTQVAETTGGKYYRATDTDSLERIYAEINQLEKTTRTMKRFSSHEELFAWLVAAALLLLALERALALTRYLRLP